MNLQEFVKSVLVDIDQAVESARSETKRDIRLSDTKDQRTVEFDVAVAVHETNSKSGKAGIRVLQFAEGGGDISKESKNSTVSRIKFGVHMDSWTKEEEARQNAQMDAYNRNNKSELT
ncbi:MAG: hypothetical protein Q7R99_03615 [bacterium]|nr:hypothetical protein [bacterium]